MDFILTVFFFILILGFLVFIHELGHFLAAKAMKVDVHEFAIGFGPSLYDKTIHGTRYTLNIIPMGGYVQLEGENEDTGPNSFRNKGFWAKALILTAGVIMNILFTIIFLAVFLSFSNYKFVLTKLADHNFTYTENVKEYFPITITQVSDTSVWNGLAEGGNIVKINGNKVDNISEFYSLIDSDYSNVTFTLFDLKTFKERDVTVSIPIYTKEGYYPITVTEISEDSVVRGILEPGEKIIGINELTFKSSLDFFKSLDTNQGNKVRLVLLSTTNSIYEKEVTLGYRDSNGAILGINFEQPNIEGISFGYDPEASNGIYFIQYNKNVLSGFAMTWDIAIYQYKVLGDMFVDAFKSGDYSNVSNTVGGLPVLGREVNRVVSVGAFNVLIPLTAFVSLSLAIVNILPFPALDGGQLAIAIIEAVSRKKIPDKIVQRVNFVGFSLLILLFILVTIKDINQLGWLNEINSIFKSILGR